MDKLYDKRQQALDEYLELIYEGLSPEEKPVDIMVIKTFFTDYWSVIPEDAITFFPAATRGLLLAVEEATDYIDGLGPGEPSDDMIWREDNINNMKVALGYINALYYWIQQWLLENGENCTNGDNESSDMYIMKSVLRSVNSNLNELREQVQKLELDMKKVVENIDAEAAATDCLKYVVD